MLPESGQISNERLEEAVKKSGADAVLVTRLLRVKKDVNVSPGYVAPGFYGRGYRGYYHGAYMAVPGDVNVYDVLTIESTLWNMKTDKPASVDERSDRPEQRGQGHRGALEGAHWKDEGRRRHLK